MTILQIVSIIFVLVSWAIPIYGIVKKIRFKTPFVLASFLTTAISAMLVLSSSEVTNEDFKDVQSVEQIWPFLEMFYRYAFLVWFVAIALNIYFMIKRVDD